MCPTHFVEKRRRGNGGRCARTATSYLRLPTTKKVDLDDSEKFKEYLASKDSSNGYKHNLANA
jgi:hypothetical protein